MARSLNPEQRRVVEHFEGPARVAAVAGSGKTTALVERVGYLVEQHQIDPRRILMVTFSVAARETVQKRLAARLPGRPGVDGIARTFHSLALDIVKKESREQFRIDTSGGWYKKSLRQAYRMAGLRSSNIKTGSKFASIIKAHFVDREAPAFLDYAAQHAGIEMHRDALVSIYDYAEEYRRLGTVTDGVPFVTFDDMLYVAAKLLQDYELRARWSSRWDFILQDEVQDESPVQAVIAEALARRHGNYVVVGDTAQCIYAWRGSSPKHLLDFDKTWDCKTIGMHRNYRSGVEIVDLANRIMGKMPRDSVIDIRMTSERGSRSFVSYEVYDTAEAEAEAITGACARMAEEGRPWTDMAVLVRMRRQTRAVETAMHRHRIPVRLVSGSSFFSQPETKTLFGYLRLADGRATKADVASALMFPSRGLGAVFVAAVERALPSCEDDWLKAVRVAASLDPRARVSALSWCALIEDLRKLADKTPYQILDHALTATGYVEWAQRNMEDDEDSVALDNIEEVKNYIADFASLKTLLDEVDAIVASSKRVRKAVTISTIHAAKGQEYPVVFVPGLQGGTFPTPKGDFDEERRVFYVAVTRAMDELWLSRAAAADHGQALRDSHFATEVALSEFVKTEVVGKSGHVATAPTQMELL